MCKQVNREVMEVIEKLKNKEEDKAESEEGEDASMEEKAESESEENCETTDPEVETPVVTEEAELPRKRAKLDTDTVVPATMVVPDMK